MLAELKITDFATIESLHLVFNSDFNVLTGETGAGKSIILDAMIMLLGGRGDTNFIRSGSKKATLEGIFNLSSYLQNIITPILEAEGLDDDEAPDRLILGRELRATGRSFCRVNGRTVNLSLLAAVANPLIDIHGQHEHLSLMRVPQHQRLLDRYAGLDKQRQRVKTEVRKLQQTRKELHNLLTNERELARQVDQLTFQVEEIDGAELQVNEDTELEIERKRLANAEQLGQLSGEIYHLLMESRDDEYPSINDLLGQANRMFGQLTKLDETVTKQLDALEIITYQLEELGDFVRTYIDEVEFQPQRLQEIEERLTLIFSLKRKYGASIEEVLAYADEARAKLDLITHSEERITELRQQEEQLRQTVGHLAQKLSQARQKAGKTMAKGIVSQLKDLGMPHTRFAVDVQWKDDPAGVYVTDDTQQPRTVAVDEQGIDRVEFLIAPNPGEPLKPLVKVASGGETSRVMLALKTVLASADDTPTLIFDEIDQGIGGRIGGVVGRKLWELSANGKHQVLCVTHLPQIAGYADQHYHVSKQIINKRTKTGVRILNHDDQVDEIAQMLGTLSNSTRASAREILDQAQTVKV